MHGAPPVRARKERIEYALLQLTGLDERRETIAVAERLADLPHVSGERLPPRRVAVRDHQAPGATTGNPREVRRSTPANARSATATTSSTDARSMQPRSAMRHRPAPQQPGGCSASVFL